MLSMTSFRQIEATGPITEKRATSAPGLTAETVIGALEDAEDYKGFEAAITAGFDERSAYLPAASYG